LFFSAPCGLWHKQCKEQSRGGRKNKTRKRRTSAPARKKKYVRTFFFFFFFYCVFVRFSARGVQKHEKKIEYVSKKNTGEIFFSGEELFLEIFQLFFLSIFFVALVKRLSVRGTQKRDKKVLGGRASIFFPPYRFFFSAFLGVSR
jgi:hypothetical protein